MLRAERFKPRIAANAHDPTIHAGRARASVTRAV